MRLLEPFRHRRFSVYWLGTAVSRIGDGVTYVALPWQVYAVSNVPTAMAIVGALQMGTLVTFVLVGGVLSDRVERRLVLLFAHLFRGIAVTVIAVLAFSGVVELWQLFVLGALFGAGQALAGPAAGSIVPELVPDALVVPAYSALQAMYPLTFRFAGPALGGFLIHLAGTGTAFLLDGVSFAVAAASLALIPARAVSRNLDGVRRSVVADIREAFAYVRARVWLWGTLAWAFLVLPLGSAPYVVLLPYLVKNDLGGDAGDLGLIFAAGGLGSALLSLVIGQVGVPRRHITFMWALWALGAIDLALYAATQAPWQAMVVALCTELGWAGGSLVWIALVQRTVPDELLGRVRSVDWLTSIGLVPLSFVVIGPLAAWLGVRPVLAGSACGALGLTVLAYFLPGMRETERDGSPAQVVLSQPEPA